MIFAIVLVLLAIAHVIIRGRPRRQYQQQPKQQTSVTKRRCSMGPTTKPVCHRYIVPGIVDSNRFGRF